MGTDTFATLVSSPFFDSRREKISKHSCTAAVHQMYMIKATGILSFALMFPDVICAIALRLCLKWIIANTLTLGKCLDDKVSKSTPELMV